MTKAQALDKFFNVFLSSYPVTSVPDDVKFPYGTYEVQTGSFGDAPVSIVYSMWFHTNSEKIPNEAVEDVRSAIGRGGVILACDGGAMWVKRGEPFSISTNLQNDNSVKTRQINITIEYLTD